jgi:ribosomal protein L11 methyltransferase
LLIKPSWSRRRPRKGQSVVVLDPGLSFGTGQHPTTGFCLRQLAARRKPAARQSFLDIGTGSGILAIAAAKLGYEPVEAFDFDAEAVRIARENAAKNQVSAGIRLRRQDVTKLPLRSAGKYSVICANLIANLLLSERGRLLARLPEDGVLVLAGILKTEFRQVQRAFESAGLRLVASRTEHEWRSGAFIWHRA